MLPEEKVFERPRETAPISLAARLRDYEANLITWALRATNGNRSKAATLLQIKRSTLVDRIKHCGLGGDHVSSDC
jgi:DNA-binding NtrC family response regulator